MGFAIGRPRVLDPQEWQLLGKLLPAALNGEGLLLLNGLTTLEPAARGQ